MLGLKYSVVFKMKQALGLGLLAGVFAVGCTDVRLNPQIDPPVVQKSTDNFCIHEPEKVSGFTKFIFLVDKSGSNGGFGGTDPGVQKRADNIAKFIEENRDKDYYQYSIIGFSSDLAGNDRRFFINNPKFTPDVDVALQGVAALRGANDGGTTPYRAALGDAEGSIIEDINANPDERSHYIVFFISDGEPTDGSGRSDLRGLVSGLVATPGALSITFSTAFYGPNGSGAQDLLSEMADAGGGKYINFETSKDWDFNELINRPDVVPWKLKQFMVYNINSAVCLLTDLSKGENFVGTDSDADGLCDRDEIRLNREYKDQLALEGLKFDPANRFSFGGAYGDAFHYLRIAVGKALDPSCDDRSDVDHDLLTFCEEKFILNKTPPPNVPGQSDPELFDTDRDGILDGIEVFMYLPKGLFWGLDNTNLEDSQDGEENAREQIEQHRNPWEKDRNVTIPYDITLRSAPIQQGRDCYQYSQSSLPLYPTLAVAPENTLEGLAHKANENVVSVHYIQIHDNEPDSEGILLWKNQVLLNNQINSDLQGENAGIKIDGLEVYDPGEQAKK